LCTPGCAVRASHTSLWGGPQPGRPPPRPDFFPTSTTFPHHRFYNNSAIARAQDRSRRPRPRHVVARSPGPHATSPQSAASPPTYNQPIFVQLIDARIAAQLAIQRPPTRHHTAALNRRQRPSGPLLPRGEPPLPAENMSKREGTLNMCVERPAARRRRPRRPAPAPAPVLAARGDPSNRAVMDESQQRGLPPPAPARAPLGRRSGAAPFAADLLQVFLAAGGRGGAGVGAEAAATLLAPVAPRRPPPLERCSGGGGEKRRSRSGRPRPVSWQQRAARSRPPASGARASARACRMRLDAYYKLAVRGGTIC
jgi:hypothetical protein